MIGVTTVAACSGGSDGNYGSSTPTSPSAPAPPSAMVITITGQNGNRSFSPNPASVGGAVVVFRNTDSVVHRIRLNNGAIDTGDIPAGATSREVTMPATGTNYHCSIHPTMIGAVNPQSGGEPPACTDYCGDY